LDALVPLFPEFQTHLQPENDRQQHLRRSFELYGPVWIFITMVIEFLILGHFAKLLSSGNTDMGDGVLKRYQFFSPETANANQSLHKIATMSFLLAVFFLGVPLS